MDWSIIAPALSTLPPSMAVVRRERMGKDCSRQSYCIPYIHVGHAQELRLSDISILKYAILPLSIQSGHLYFKFILYVFSRR
jgi:hypothetical protein